MRGFTGPCTLIEAIRRESLKSVASRYSESCGWECGQELESFQKTLMNGTRFAG